MDAAALHVAQNESLKEQTGLEDFSFCHSL